jgi:hypothetical protein
LNFLAWILLYLGEVHNTRCNLNRLPQYHNSEDIYHGTTCLALYFVRPAPIGPDMGLGAHALWLGCLLGIIVVDLRLGKDLR